MGATEFHTNMCVQNIMDKNTGKLSGMSINSMQRYKELAEALDLVVPDLLPDDPEPIDLPNFPGYRYFWTNVTTLQGAVRIVEVLTVFGPFDKNVLTQITRNFDDVLRGKRKQVSLITDFGITVTEEQVL